MLMAFANEEADCVKVAAVRTIFEILECLEPGEYTGAVIYISWIRHTVDSFVSRPFGKSRYVVVFTF